MLYSTYYCQGVLQCIYSMEPDRNNLETFVNITVQFYIAQVFTLSSNLLTNITTMGATLNESLQSAHCMLYVDKKNYFFWCFSIWKLRH